MFDEVNACFGADGFGWKPGKRIWVSALFSASYVRLYALFNDRTGSMKGRLSPKAQENLEKSFWQCAKVYSKLAEAKDDVWVKKVLKTTTSRARYPISSSPSSSRTFPPMPS